MAAARPAFPCSQRSTSSTAWVMTTLGTTTPSFDRRTGRATVQHPSSTLGPSMAFHTNSRCSTGPALLLCQGWVRFERVEDNACELSFEAADRFAAAFPFCLFAFEVGTCGRVVARLRDRDPVEGGVELAVAAAVEAVALHAA